MYLFPVNNYYGKFSQNSNNSIFHLETEQWNFVANPLIKEIYEISFKRYI